MAPGWLGIIALGDVPDLSAQEYRLLAALGHALGAAPDFTGPASLLRWPLNNNPRLDHSEAAAIDRQSLSRTLAALDALPEALRAPLILCAIEGLSQSEAAEALGLSAKAIELRVRRARAALRDAME